MAEGNGRDALQGLPWWLKGIVVVGVPSAIALGLVWSDRAQLSSYVHDNNRILSTMVQTDADHDQRISARFTALSEQTEEMSRILVATCVNAAKNDDQRARCVGAR